MPTERAYTMRHTTTYLHFNGNCRTAMACYRHCFGGELEVMAYPDASGNMCDDSFGITWILNCAQAG